MATDKAYKLDIGGTAVPYEISPNLVELPYQVNTIALHGNTSSNAIFQAVQYGDLVFCQGSVKLNIANPNQFVFSIPNINTLTNTQFALISCETQSNGICGEGYVENNGSNVHVCFSILENFQNVNAVKADLRFNFVFRKYYSPTDEVDRIIRKVSFADDVKTVTCDITSKVEYNNASNTYATLQKIDNKIVICNVESSPLPGNSDWERYDDISVIPAWATPASSVQFPMANYSGANGLGAFGQVVPGPDVNYIIRMHTPYAISGGGRYLWYGQCWYPKSNFNTNISQINLGDSTDYKIIPVGTDQIVESINTDWLTNVTGYKMGRFCFVTGVIKGRGNIGIQTLAESLLTLKYAPVSKTCSAISGYANIEGHIVFNAGSKKPGFYLNNSTTNGDLRFCLMYVTQE